MYRDLVLIEKKSTEAKLPTGSLIFVDFSNSPILPIINVSTLCSGVARD